MDINLSTSERSNSYISVLRGSHNSKSLSDVYGDSVSAGSQPSSTDELAHTNAIKRIKKESTPSKPDESVEITESLQSCSIDQYQLSDSSEVQPEDVTEDVKRYSECFKNKKSHFFILSQSGKPIFSRYGSDNQTAAFIGVMQAMVSYVASNNEGDSLKLMRAGSYNFAFVTKDHMILVAVSKSAFVPQQLRIILNHLHNQILSILTYRTIQRLFERQPGVDLRRLLVGTDRYLLGMIEFMEAEMSPFLNSITCAPMQHTLRQALLATISQSIKINIKHLLKDLVFCILLLNEKLVGVVRRKDQQPHPMDLQLLLNLIRNSEYFKSQICWLPVCLPKFDADGFLHAHISYLDDSSGLCLIQLTVNPDQFDILQQSRDTIIDSMQNQGLLAKLSSIFTVEQMVHSYKLQNDIYRFVYKMRNASQSISYKSPVNQLNPDVYKQSNNYNIDTETIVSNDSSLVQPIIFRKSRVCLAGNILEDNKSRNNADSVISACSSQCDDDWVFSRWLRMHNLIHLSERNARLVYECYEDSTIIAWQTLNFELYAHISAVNSKRKIMDTMNKLLDAINKQKSRLFVLISPTF